MKLHNTPTKKTEDFTPSDPSSVKLYTCGPTVYNYLHVGNWAAYIYWDILVRVLRANNWNVERVMNITDVGHLTSDADDGEDKLEKGAKREGKTAWDVAAFYTKDFLRGMQELALVPPEHLTRATDFIPEQFELIRTLQERGYTYQISDGIYFDTSKFARYADFAHLDIAAQKAGARVERNEEKRNPSDFALWKFSPSDATRDMEWATPEDLITGEPKQGFPGWHLECSAMAMNILGDTLDIHTGGIDHIPVHHTNEIAQSEAATGKQFSRFWLHNNHIKVEGTKISKSLNNGYTLGDLAKADYTPLDYKMFVLQTHYRTEGNFTFSNLDAAAKRRKNWRNVAALRWQAIGEDIAVNDVLATVRQELDDDLNTPRALARIDEVFNDIHIATISSDSLDKLLQALDEWLGLELRSTTTGISDETKSLIAERDEARRDKDFARSDRIRDELAEQGIGLLDTSGTTVWQYL